jgi:hypothetical protein
VKSKKRRIVREQFIPRVCMKLRLDLPLHGPGAVLLPAANGERDARGMLRPFHPRKCPPPCDPRSLTRNAPPLLRFQRSERKGKERKGEGFAAMNVSFAHPLSSDPVGQKKDQEPAAAPLSTSASTSAADVMLSSGVAAKPHAGASLSVCISSPSIGLYEEGKLMMECRDRSIDRYRRALRVRC